MEYHTDILVISEHTSLSGVLMQYNPRAATRSIYLHWPFCLYKCHFCPLAGNNNFMERYHKALVREVELFGERYEGPCELDTIFFGGGTASTYPDHLLLDTFDTLKKVFSFSTDIEVSVEINPSTVRPEQLKLWQELGMNRLSIGVQSLKDQVLQTLNGHQSAQDVHELLSYAPTYIKNLSVDLILGLPGVSSDEWKELIKQAVTWPIRHISVYFLTMDEDTPLSVKEQTNRVPLPTDEEMVMLYQWTVERLAQSGFKRYELSNFSKPGYESRHHIVYWDRKPYKAFGLGACSFDGIHRFQNDKNVQRYIESIEQEKDITCFYETLTPSQVLVEKLMLGLRRSAGVSIKDLFVHFSPQQKKRFAETAQRFKDSKLLIEKDDKLVLTTQGMVVENEIIVQLSQ